MTDWGEFTIGREIMTHKDDDDWLAGWRLPALILLVLFAAACTAGFIIAYVVL